MTVGRRIFEGRQMAYIVFWATMALFLLFVFIKGALDARKNRRLFVQKLYNDYGKAPDRQYKVERFLRIGSYFKRHRSKGQIDDITWNDLNMDEIFKRMNYTLSSTGEEYLYYTLRTPQFQREALEHQEEIVRFFEKHPDERVSVMMLMKKLGNCGKYSLYDYLDYLDQLGKRSNLRQLLLDLALIPIVAFCFYQTSVGLLALAVLLIYNITNYFVEKKKIEPYITSFAYVMRLLEVSNELVRIPIPECKEEWSVIKACTRSLSKVKMGSGWVLISSFGGMGSTGGNPLEIIMDYLNMMFHIDIMIFNKMLDELKMHIKDVDMLVSKIGMLETAICIDAYRASINDNWCIPLFLNESTCKIRIEEMYHPLIDDPVKNSIQATKGVLITGSNASGKSTFLKTTALNAILAQTIFTCLADRYEANFFNVYSSMALRDNIEGGESYYIVEIKALKRILDASTGAGHVLCFVDEVLRGTNTVERIAASTQILKSLTGKQILCFAATHDIELTELLKDDYDNYHFEEEIMDGDIFFPYKLMNGKAVTRNAIKLLELIGYDKLIIDEAIKQANLFMITGEWMKR